MITSIFETAKIVAARAAAEHYGLKVNRNGMTCCIFHEDKSPSMKLDERYYCFGCGATGDAVDLTARLFGLSPYEAAKKLAYDFGLSAGRPSVVARLRKPVPDKTDEQRCRSVLTDYYRHLQNWKTEYAPSPEDEDWHPLFVEALQKSDCVEYLLDILDCGDEPERAFVVKDTREEVMKLERRIAKLDAPQYLRTGTER